MKNLSSILKSTILFFLSLVIFLSIFSYSSRDIIFLSQPPAAVIHNYIGVLGAYLAFALLFVFGYAAYFFPFFLFFLSLATLGAMRFHGLGKNWVINVFSFCFFVVFLCAFISLFFKTNEAIFKYSGLTGHFLGGFFSKYMGVQGSYITLCFLMSISSLLLFGYFFVDLFRAIKIGLGQAFEFLSKLWQEAIADRGRDQQEDKAKRMAKLFPVFKKNEAKKAPVVTKVSANKPTLEPASAKLTKKDVKPEIKIYTPKIDLSGAEKSEKEEKIINKEAVQKKIEALENQATKKFDPQTYKLPSIGLLKVPPAQDYTETKENIEVNIKNLEETFREFGVEVKVVSVQRGPVVTMYELEPSAGVKITKISALADDLALAMKSSSVRIVAPLPGRGTVGIEIPNEKKQAVYLREVLEEKAFTSAVSKLTIAIGKDVSGNPVAAELNEMPHLLIAGTTGAGKTVCVNSLITSILFKARPDEVKFILIDPKMVELASFAGIPHLIHPIISESKKAFVAINWAVAEMERRYKMLAENSARNITVYNSQSKDKMPYIIIVVDEFADLMVVAKENIELSVQRLAQLSRAVGIHLVLATQRPSVDVITGVIKANFPARISFKVSAKVDSRTILDAMGADKLLGKGDLLFLKPGAPKLIRAQGCFIDDEDIETITDFIRSQGGPIYEQGIVESEKKAALNIENDELLDEAIKTVLQARQASASILQRRLRVGYTRAARLLDLMEQQGVVGPFCGSKAREILVNPETYALPPATESN
jgi:S-DNA-T family DNA segregation ATPase FtsK/SpoIIIE